VRVIDILGSPALIRRRLEQWLRGESGEPGDLSVEDGIEVLVTDYNIVAQADPPAVLTVSDCDLDSGNPLGNCLEVTKTGARELSPDMGAATGYSIISADSREDAERLLEGCPIISSVRLYEAMAM